MVGLVGGVKLGGWTIDIDWDDSVVAADGCTPAEVGLTLCSDHFGATTGRTVGADKEGTPGIFLLAEYFFIAIGDPGECTRLTLTVLQFADPEGNETSPTETDGEICIGDPPTPSPTETPAATPQPTATPAALPDTGGWPGDRSE